MDEGLSRAVREAFVALYERRADLPRQAHRSTGARAAARRSPTTKWSTRRAGQPLVHPLPAQGRRQRLHVTVATTRPETMLGDTAVAVHPRRRALRATCRARAGAAARRAARSRSSPTMPSIRSSAPARSRSRPRTTRTTSRSASATTCAQINVIDRGRHDERERRRLRRHGPLRGRASAARRPARAQRLAREVDEHYAIRRPLLPLPHRRSSRTCPSSGSCEMSPLAEPRSTAVRRRQDPVLPGALEERLLHWLENVRDWCISRQIWWGHRIPAWYCETAARSRRARPIRRSARVRLRRTSAGRGRARHLVAPRLWPFSTLGWPETTPMLRTSTRPPSS